MDEEIKKLNKKAEDYSLMLEALKTEMGKVIVGQNDAIKKLIIALLSGGHVLLEGVPGLAKTLMIRTLAGCLRSDFVRIQFTPDLLPADIIGTKIYENFKFKTYKGPVFANFILADEINRAPPKVQSALLEAMQERQVSIQGDTFKLPEPFFVLATQNPIESEGTYKLPEAQLDRFMFKLLVDYPSKTEELEIISRFTEDVTVKASSVLGNKKIIEMQSFVKKIYADEKIKNYVADIVDATRHPEDYNLHDLKPRIEYGASPRASLWLIISAKANALLNGRGYVKPEDVKVVAYDVLRHRIILTYEAEAEEITPDDIITDILNNVRVP